VPIPIGTNGPVHELLQLQNGDILLVGDFTSAFGVAANRIARWNGSAATGCSVSASPTSAPTRPRAASCGVRTAPGDRSAAAAPAR